MKNTSSLLLIGLLSITVLTEARAQVPAGEVPIDGRTIIELEPSELGRQVDAWGFAVKKLRPRTQSFAVRVFGNVRDGTLLEVLVEADGERHEIGTIRMYLGSGLLLLNSTIDLSRVFPLSRIQSVTVSYRDQKMLHGAFFPTRSGAADGDGENAATRFSPPKLSVLPPDLCPEIYLPVCGTDGQTYPNACYAKSARVGIAHEGKCGSRRQHDDR